MPRRTYTPKHSTVIAYLALFSSLGTGGAFAATQLARNSVGSRQIRTGAVQLSDLSPAALRALRGKVGPAGATGATGAAGAPGQVSTANIIQRETDGPIAFRPGANGGFVGLAGQGCADDERVLGGGGQLDTGTATQGTAALMYSAPNANGRRWDVGFASTTDTGIAHVYAICLKP